MALPKNRGFFHFVGIGGIGMSSIAELLYNLGYAIQGSDISYNANIKRMEQKGIKIKIGHSEENIKNARVVIVSTAVCDDNIEVLEARKERIPVIHRSEMLAELMRLQSSIAVGGTHGKTTTTSLVAAILDAGGQDPTVINGGIINTYGSNARLGKGEWLVAEADESDGSFLRLPAEVGIITNIEPEHLDYYDNLENIKTAFDTFVHNLPFYGFAVVCLDHHEVQSLVGRIKDREIITYGIENRQANLFAKNIRYSPKGINFDVLVDGIKKGEEARTIKDITLHMFGKYNILNSLAAIAVGIRLGINDSAIKQGLLEFKGVKRRFTIVDKVNDITIVDDYAHHPTEINSVLKAAQEACTKGRVIAIVQPHRYTRLQCLFEEFTQCFNDADTVVIADVYPAGEQPIKGINKNSLAEAIIASGHKDVRTLDNKDKLPSLINYIANKGDYVIFLGAGSISSWANEIPKLL